MKLNLKLIIGLVLLVLLLIFIVQNAVVVELHFLLWTLSMSRSLIILFTLFIGVVLGWLLSSYFHHRWQRIPHTAMKQQTVNDDATSDDRD
jgi:uncharacterized integral membrane protein